MGVSFGFEIKESRYLDLDTSHNRLTEEIARKVPAWNACLRCGNCAAVCPVGRGVYTLDLSGFHPLTCYLCGKCHLACPRGIPTRQVILETLSIIEKGGSHV